MSEADDVEYFARSFRVFRKYFSVRTTSSLMMQIHGNDASQQRDTFREMPRTCSLMVPQVSFASPLFSFVAWFREIVFEKKNARTPTTVPFIFVTCG